MTLQEAIAITTAYPNGMWAYPDIIVWKEAHAQVKRAADEILRRESSKDVAAMTDGGRG